MLFTDLKLIEPIIKAITNEGYTQPTPIQENAIPSILQGRDFLGCAQTGTGKTAAFAIPILQILAERKKQNSKNHAIKALILTPTRELAIQIEESFDAYGKYLPLKKLVIFGGVKQYNQTQSLKKGVDILVATPGRLLDLINQGFISLKNLEIFVLDEADRMLDMGFVHDVKKIIKIIPQNRQTLFLSATMPKEINELAQSILTNPLKVEIAPVSSTADTINQSIYFVDKKEKNNLLLTILEDKRIETALVFSRTKHGADKIVKFLHKHDITAAAIHGNKSQNARQNALNAFKERKIRILVATDIAARGIDVEELSHVINYELPDVPETYVHRIGRTGRAGNLGVSFSFCEEEELINLKDIQKLINKQLNVVKDHPYHIELSVQNAVKKKKPQNQSFSRKNTQPNTKIKPHFLKKKGN